jgi:hypothetical protein
MKKKQPYQTGSKTGKFNNLAAKPGKKTKMLPRVAPKKVKKVGKYSNGVGVGP